MNALLQHRGHNLMGAGRSIAVQNFNEQACIPGPGRAVRCRHAFGASAFGSITIFGLLVAADHGGAVGRWRAHNKIEHAEELNRLLAIALRQALSATPGVRFPLKRRRPLAGRRRRGGCSLASSPLPLPLAGAGEGEGQRRCAVLKPSAPRAPAPGRAAPRRRSDAAGGQHLVDVLRPGAADLRGGRCS